MKKTFKKFLSMLIAVMMIVTANTVVFAAETVVTYGGSYIQMLDGNGVGIEANSTKYPQGWRNPWRWQPSPSPYNSSAKL
ncbi:MAG: hypothetical protein FWB74_02435 [Defluviitaleaceae bacterium]|nr:hypothetical protein [Defluviitaleaceae bacterium]